MQRKHFKLFLGLLIAVFYFLIFFTRNLQDMNVQFASKLNKVTAVTT